MTDQPPPDRDESKTRDEPMTDTPPHPSQAEGADSEGGDTEGSERPPRPSQAEGERSE